MLHCAVAALWYCTWMSELLINEEWCKWLGALSVCFGKVKGEEDTKA